MPETKVEKTVIAVTKSLRARREALGLSMNQVAKMSGLDQRAVSRFEKGELSPTLRSLLKIAKVLDVKLYEVLQEHE